MAIVAEFDIPAEAVPLGSVFEQLPDVRIELERVVPANDAALPFFWIFGDDPDDFVDLAEREPEIAELHVLAEVGNTVLIRAKWRTRAEIIEGIKQLRATILDASGTAEGWEFQVRATERHRLLEFQRVFGEQDIPVTLNRIYETAELTNPDGPLTDGQKELLLEAYQIGYFNDPRQATQGDLAERFDISSRAVSKQLRRGTRNLISSNLVDTPRENP